MNHFWGFFLLVRTCLYLKNADNWIFMQNKISQLKYLVVAEEMLWVIFCLVLLIKRWRYLKITEGWLFRYILQMGVLQITEITTSHPKSVMTSCKCLKLYFLFCFVTQNGWCYVRMLCLLPRHILQIGALQIMKYQMASNIWQRCLVKMAETNLHLQYPLAQCCIKGHSKFRLTKMAPHKRDILKINQLNPWQINFGHFFARCVILVSQKFL